MAQTWGLLTWLRLGWACHLVCHCSRCIVVGRRGAGCSMSARSEHRSARVWAGGGRASERVASHPPTSCCWLAPAAPNAPTAQPCVLSVQGKQQHEQAEQEQLLGCCRAPRTSAAGRAPLPAAGRQGRVQVHAHLAVCRLSCGCSGAGSVRLGSCRLQRLADCPIA